MSALIAPKLGFNSLLKKADEPQVDGDLNEKLSRSATEAARRKFTPEFMNRVDKCVVFKPLGEAELRRILDLELKQVQDRIRSADPDKMFALTVSEPGKEFLLSQGTDLKYGARHLKRAIERLLVHPLSNLMATSQVSMGDWIKADFDKERCCLLFTVEEEGLSISAMSSILGNDRSMPAAVAAGGGGALPALKPVPSKPSKK